MPKGFLVKRTKHSGSYSHRIRHCSDDDRSESGGSDQEYVHTNFGSPDSGYSASPISVSFRERYGQCADFISVKPPLVSSAAASPVTSSTVSNLTYPSPLYYATFDRLTFDCDSPLGLRTPEKCETVTLATKTPQKSETHQRPKTPEQAESPTLRNHFDNRLEILQTFEKSDPPTTPISPNKRRGNSENNENKTKTPKKPKAARKINFDKDNSSPVSGTIIRNLTDTEDGARVVCGDIDSKFNCVEVTAEAKAEIAKIENKIGEYICQLCKECYEDAFQLAQHRCTMIINIEYRCPECDKVFNCPANLASHRRWHKPRAAVKSATPTKILPAIAPQDQLGASPSTPVGQTNEGQFPCDKCSKKFRRQAYLRKHQQCHVTDAIFVCQHCSKVFPNDNARAKHEVTHVGGKELTCTLCNSSFANKIVLEKHVRHHGTDTFNCKYCNSTFCSSPGLTRHINKCHPSENRQVILLQLPVNRTC